MRTVVFIYLALLILGIAATLTFLTMTSSLTIRIEEFTLGGLFRLEYHGAMRADEKDRPAAVWILPCSGEQLETAQDHSLISTQRQKATCCLTRAASDFGSA